MLSRSELSKYLSFILLCDNVIEMIDNREQENRILSRCLFMAILESIQYLARQGIPLFGRGNDGDSNLLQILVSRSKTMPELKDWLEKNHG